LAVSCLTALEPLQAAETVSDQASEAQKKIAEAGQAATAGVAEIWRRIDERRLMNRTPDQLVAWVIMGLLAAGLIRPFSKFKAPAILGLGLAGAFLGGIVANVTRVDLGLGPVLIRYEDLLASLVGAALLMIAAWWLRSRKPPQP
jgi:hypothetical protein